MQTIFFYLSSSKIDLYAGGGVTLSVLMLSTFKIKLKLSMERYSLLLSPSGSLGAGAVGEGISV